MAKRLDNDLRREVKYLITVLGFRNREVNEILGTDLTQGAVSRIKASKLELTGKDLSRLEKKFGGKNNAEKEIALSIDDKKEVKIEEVKEIETKQEEMELILNKDKIENKLDKLFGITLEDLMYVSEYEQQQKRDLVVIAEEFENAFGITFDKQLAYSFQEKHEALKRRDLNALKIIIEKINYVQRRTISETHKWKFNPDERGTRKDKIVGHIINLVKSELDGTSYCALSETQHKTVEIICNLMGIKEGELSLEAERKILKLMAEKNTFDLINRCIEVSRKFDMGLEFINKVEEELQ